MTHRRIELSILCAVLTLLLTGQLAVAGEFSILFNEREEAPYQADWLVFSEYQDRMGVTLDVILGNDNNYIDDVRRLVESGQMPDIVLKVWPAEIETYASQGVLLPFSDYLDQLPEFARYIDENDLADEVESLYSSDGKLYILPGFQREIQVQQWIYRSDLFRLHSLPVPESLDELLAALQELKLIYPDSTPLTASWGGAHLFAIMGASYGIPAGWHGTRAFNDVLDRWEFAPATDSYREMLSYLRRCYDAGVLDPEIYTQSFDEYLLKMQDGRAFASVTWISSGFDNWNTALRENGVDGGQWEPLRVPRSTIGLSLLPAVDSFRKGLIVPARMSADPNLKELLAFLDWAVYSEEGRTLTAWGVEGITYTQTEAGKSLLPSVISPRTPDGELDLATDFGFASLFDLNENAEFEDYKKPDNIVSFLQESLLADETANPLPQLVLDTGSLQAVGEIKPSLDTYAAEASKAFVTGEMDIDLDWDSYLTQLESLGLRTLETIWNLAWSQQGG